MVKETRVFGLGGSGALIGIIYRISGPSQDLFEANFIKFALNTLNTRKRQNLLVLEVITH